jgi:2,4-dienoyl-CoA reductase-like NADH-dependent reductase (Old Yellow Enzyme family)/thioredoxin reductase
MLLTKDPFTSLAVGPVELANRFALAPVKTAFGSTDGTVSPRHVAYYRRRAEGGAALIIVEPLFVDPLGREHPRQLGAHTDDVIAGLRELVDAVHGAGAMAFAHLNHAGRAANPKVIGGAPEAPSAVTCAATGATPTAMSQDRIQRVLRAYAEAARRAREAGFDGVEIQLGLGYLPAQFMSQRTNRRTDRYGVEQGDRWVFVEELISSVRASIGEGLALVSRVSADEKVDGGMGIDDALELASHLEDWDVDGLHVVTGSACDSPPWYYQHMALPAEVNETLSGRVRSAVSVPVMVAGRLGTPDRIRTVLERGLADVVALGRPLLADPDLPRKMREGREDEIVACGSCLQGCLAQVKSGRAVACLINPELGREYEAHAAAAVGGRLVVVVGGGPAGMQAALSADRCGYDVTLLEKKPSLGGQFALATAAPGKGTMDRPLQSLIRAVERSGIDVRTGVEAGVETVLELEPDRVIVATGSRPAGPPVEGLDDPLTAEQVLEGTREPGRRVLVLGGGLVGIELAEYMAGKGREVEVVEVLEDVARDMETVTRKMTLRRLASLPIKLHTNARLTRLDDAGAFVRIGDAEGETSLGHFDSVLVAVGQRPYDPLSKSLEAAGVEVTVIGDAVHPGQILDATRAGYDAAKPPKDAGSGR